MGAESVVIIDNYDSFVYNIAQYLGELGADAHVFRNDEIDVNRIEELSPSHLIISPGPCTPREAGISNEVIRAFAGKIPILGVCLGHQCIGYAYGGTVSVADRLMHGKTSPILHDGKTIYAGMPNPFTGIRYHSLLVQPDPLPEVLEVSAKTPEGEIMGLRHRTYTVEGVQFHPESILTEQGKTLLENFLNVRGGQWDGAARAEM
jgi:anthranilate synthase/aminodeoxychorismate synthase-like glutamine amidotransferase